MAKITCASTRANVAPRLDSSTKREMLIVVASDIEPIRIREASWIAIGRRYGNEDRFSGWDWYIGHSGVR